MTDKLKGKILSGLRLVFTPLRRSYSKRNGTTAVAQRVEFPNEVFLALVSEKLSEGKSVTMWVKGYSMRPFIEYGRDKVKLEARRKYEVGDAVLACITPGHYVLHRIIRKDGKLVTLQGDGNVSGTERCTLSDIRGAVAEYIRPSRTIPSSDPCLRRAVRLWRTLRPIRRVLLVLYRCMAV